MINKNILKFDSNLLMYLDEVRDDRSEEYLRELKRYNSYIPPCHICSIINCNITKIRKDTEEFYNFYSLNICSECRKNNLERSEYNATVCRGELTNFGKILIGKSIVTDINIVNISNKEYSEMKLIGLMGYEINSKTILNATIRAFRISVRDEDIWNEEISFILGKETIGTIKGCSRNIYLKDDHDPLVPNIIKYLINDILTSLKVTNA